MRHFAITDMYGWLLRDKYGRLLVFEHKRDVGWFLATPQAKEILADYDLGQDEVRTKEIDLKPMGRE